MQCSQPVSDTRLSYRVDQGETFLLLRKSNKSDSNPVFIGYLMNPVSYTEAKRLCAHLKP